MVVNGGLRIFYTALGWVPVFVPVWGYPFWECCFSICWDGTFFMAGVFMQWTCLMLAVASRSVRAVTGSPSPSYFWWPRTCFPQIWCQDLLLVLPLLTSSPHPGSQVPQTSSGFAQWCCVRLPWLSSAMLLRICQKHMWENVLYVFVRENARYTVRIHSRMYQRKFKTVCPDKMYVRAHVRTRVRMHARENARLYARINVRMHTPMFKCIRAYMIISVHIHW